MKKIVLNESVQWYILHKNPCKRNPGPEKVVEGSAALMPVDNNEAKNNEVYRALSGSNHIIDTKVNYLKVFESKLHI